MLDPDNLNEPSKKACQLVALVIGIFVVVVIVGFIYYAVQLADSAVEVIDKGARQLKEYTEKRSRELEKLQKEIERLNRY